MFSPEFYFGCFSALLIFLSVYKVRLISLYLFLFFKEKNVYKYNPFKICELLM